MKLVEMGFVKDDDKGMDFDVRDDLVVYMRNDPSFYRRYYYPTMAKMSDIYKKKKKIDKSDLSTLIDRAIPMYMKKYKINRAPKDIFTDDDKNSIIEMIVAEEEDEIRNGEY